MNEAEFWGLIDSTRRGVEEDDEAHLERLTAAVADLPEPEILAFGQHFNRLWFKAYSYSLWAAAYIIGGGCSDDGFMDFRGWLISRGQAVFEQALADPQSLAKVVRDDEDECQIEGYQYVASKAWERKTGRDYLEYPWTPDGTEPSDPTGDPWNEEDLPELYPKLWRKFGD